MKGGALHLAVLALTAACAAQVATALTPWPMPMQMTAGSTSVDVSPTFKFTCSSSAPCSAQACSSNSGILSGAFSRYEALIRPASGGVRSAGDAAHRASELATADGKGDGAAGSPLTSASVCILSPDETLDQLTNASYTLSVATDSGAAAIQAPTVFGALHGMESLSQLTDATTPAHTIANAPVSIVDAPRFNYRGLLVDTARHFLPLAHLRHVIDGLAANKLNVLHWHIVDEQSFAAGSALYPELAAKGAYAPAAVYSPDDMRGLVAYAKARGVRIMVEFDVPGHGAWGKGIPKLMACSNVLDPTSSYTYDFLAAFLGEMAGIFIEPLLFLGGDEVHTACWDANPAVAKWLKEHNMTSSQLQPYFWQQMSAHVLPTLNKTIGVWEADALQIDPAALPNGTVANVYQSLSTANDTIARGMNTVVSIAGEHWYLDSECGGYNQNAWECIYQVEPLNNFTAQHTDLFWGGETSMWGEGITEDNFDAFVWRGASAGAERLWSPSHVNDVSEAQQRLSEHSCRLSMRGIKIGPVMPSFCPSDLGAQGSSGADL